MYVFVRGRTVYVGSVGIVVSRRRSYRSLRDLPPCPFRFQEEKERGIGCISATPETKLFAPLLWFSSCLIHPRIWNSSKIDLSVAFPSSPCLENNNLGFNRRFPAEYQSKGAPAPVSSPFLVRNPYAYCRVQNCNAISGQGVQSAA